MKFKKIYLKILSPRNFKKNLYYSLKMMKINPNNSMKFQSDQT